MNFSIDDQELQHKTANGGAVLISDSGGVLYDLIRHIELVTDGAI